MKTGLVDSNGKEIQVGDLVKMPCEINQEMHGAFTLYRIEQRGIVPVLVYERSEKGVIGYRGMFGKPLSECYDLKLFMTGDDLLELTPDDEFVIVDESLL